MPPFVKLPDREFGAFILIRPLDKEVKRPQSDYLSESGHVGVPFLARLTPKSGSRKVVFESENGRRSFEGS